MQRSAFFVSTLSLLGAAALGAAYLNTGMPGRADGQDLATLSPSSGSPVKGGAMAATVTRSTGEAAIGGPFSLTDQNGKRVTEKTLLGHYALVAFGYTSCPDVCPATLSTMTAALSGLGPDAKEIVPVFITVDPARDTRKVMKEYAANFDPRLRALTGSEAEVKQAASAWKVYYASHRDAAHPKDYAVDHSAFIYLMGPDGKYVAHYPYNIDAGKLTAALAATLKTSGDSK